MRLRLVFVVFAIIAALAGVALAESDSPPKPRPIGAKAQGLTFEIPKGKRAMRGENVGLAVRYAKLSPNDAEILRNAGATSKLAETENGSSGAEKSSAQTSAPSNKDAQVSPAPASPIAATGNAKASSESSDESVEGILKKLVWASAIVKDGGTVWEVSLPSAPESGWSLGIVYTFEFALTADDKALVAGVANDLVTQLLADLRNKERKDGALLLSPSVGDLLSKLVGYAGEKGPAEKILADEYGIMKDAEGQWMIAKDGKLLRLADANVDVALQKNYEDGVVKQVSAAN